MQFAHEFYSDTPKKVEKTVQNGNADLESIESLLTEFGDAIIICDFNARIRLVNPQAKQFFQNTTALHPGHSLYGLFHRAPFAQACQAFQEMAGSKECFGPDKKEICFICSTLREAALFECHMRFIPVEPVSESGYVLTFHKIKRRIDEAALKSNLLSKTIESLRSPLSNLNAAAENLKNNPGMSADERANFERVITSESATLIHKFDALVHESQSLSLTGWPLSDVYSADLIRCVIRKLFTHRELKANMIGVPQWIQADPYSMVPTLETLVLAVQKVRNTQEVDIEVVAGENGLYVDIIWKGETVAQDIVDSWLQIPLPDLSAHMTVAHVLERHNSDMWSQKHHMSKYAMLRIPALPSKKHWKKTQNVYEDRPACFSFFLQDGVNQLNEKAQTPLSTLSYVVFKTETIGNEPSSGNDILEIAAVRIVGGRILCDKTFHTLVNPNRPIPGNSRHVHGIDEHKVKGEPPISVVLPGFKSFSEDCVLVGENVGFDMKFIQSAADKAKIQFDNIILDTQLLSVLTGDRKLFKNINSTYSITEESSRRRYTLIEECFATAQRFLDLLELLNAQNLTALEQVIMASKREAAEKPCECD